MHTQEREISSSSLPPFLGLPSVDGRTTPGTIGDPVRDPSRSLLVLIIHLAI